VRGLLKGSIAVLMAALVCAAMAPVASAVQAAEESEGVFLEVTPRKDVQVWVEVHPQLGVAVLRASIGMSKKAVPRPRHGSVQYAVRIPKRPLEGRLDLTVPGIASIVGELVEGGEGLEFDGSFHFTGNGGYLSFDVARMAGEKLKRSAPLCAPLVCRGSRPTLFEYVYNPFNASNFNTQILTSERETRGRTSLFQATHYVRGTFSTFKAQTLEWLPGEVAVARTLEVEKAPGGDFKVSSKAERPKSATLRPPSPFSGSAHYEGVGSIRAPASGKLTGSLSADIYGVKARLAGPGTKASLFNFNPGL
jgi:hypothetical protein